MASKNVTEAELGELIERVAAAAKAYIRGDMRTYFTLIQHGDDFTLMSPFGGEPQRGFDTSPERLAALEPKPGQMYHRYRPGKSRSAKPPVFHEDVRRNHGRAGHVVSTFTHRAPTRRWSWRL